MAFGNPFRPLWIAIICFLFTPFLTHCSFEDYVAAHFEWLQLSIGGVVLWSAEEVLLRNQTKVAVKPAPSETKPTVIPTRPVSKRTDEWGNCDDPANWKVNSIVKRAEITVGEIKMKKSGTDQWVSVTKTPIHADLFGLASFLSRLLTERELPEGEYDEIGVVPNEAVVVDEAGKTWPIQIPIDNGKGIRIQLSRAITVRANTPGRHISLTFCTQKNLEMNEGNDGNTFTFHPKINKAFNLSL